MDTAITKKIRVAMYKNLKIPGSSPIVALAEDWIESDNLYIRVSDIIKVELTMLPEDKKAELESRLENARVTKEKADRAYYELEKQVCG